MITLYAFGPHFSLPDPSPFVMKAEILLKMAGLPYKIDLNGFRKAPKGKLPYINDDGDRIADSTFIRSHIERKYKFDFDRGLSAEQRAVAWAFEKMAEDNLYWTVVDARWMDDANLNAAPADLKLTFRNQRRIFSDIAPHVTRFEPGAEVASGITTLPAPGHTPGHISVITRTSGRTPTGST